MTKKLLGFEAPPSLAIAAGAITPNPGLAGVQAWSTTLGALVTWNGTSWNASSGSSPASNVVVNTSASMTMAATAGSYFYFVTGAHLMSLPSPNTNRYTVKNNHTANITIDTAGPELLEGAASIAIGPGSAVDLISNGTNWFVI